MVALAAVAAASVLFSVIIAAPVDARLLHGSSGGGAGGGPEAGWTYGRATNYDTIDVGSCGYGVIGSSAITGRDVAASCEKNADFGGSCGRCYEVQCVDRTVKDKDAPG